MFLFAVLEGCGGGGGLVGRWIQCLATEAAEEPPMEVQEEEPPTVQLSEEEKKRCFRRP